MNFGLSVYPSYLGTFVIVLVGRILIEMLDYHSAFRDIKISLRTNKYAIFSVICATILYKVILNILRYKHIVVTDFYNMQTISISQIPNKFLICIKACWTQFTDWAMPFYPNILTKLFLILAIIFLIQILLSKRKIVIKVFILMTFVISLFLTKIDAFIALANVMYLSRVEFCGYVLFNALIIAIGLKLGGVLQNIKIIISCLIIYLFAVNCFWQQRTWKFGFDAEKMMWSNMQNNIGNSVNFDPMKKYDILQLGNYISIRENFYIKKAESFRDPDLIASPIDYPYFAFITLDFYNFKYAKKMHRINDFTNSDFMSALKRLYDAGLLENAKAWPAQNSIIVYEDIILVIMDEKDLQKAKQLLATQIQKEKTLENKSKANLI
jgi:hypothetical protein